MNLSKSVKVVLGLLTISPLLIFIGGFLFAAYQFISTFFADDPMMPLLLLSYLGYIIPYIFSYFLIYIALGIFYLIHILRNPSFDTEKRILWIVVLVTAHIFSMPAYWYLHLWKTDPNRNADSTFESTHL